MAELPTPSTATVSPGHAPLLRRALNVLIPAHMSGPASTAECPSGISAKAWAKAIMYSA